MKVISTLIIALIFVGLSGCSNALMEDGSTDIPKGITAFQQFMLDEINLARTKPAEYAELRLKADKEMSADNGSYLYLKSLTPAGALTFNYSLNLSASNYANLLAEKNLAEHNADGTPLKRALRAGFTGTSTGENIAIASASSFNAVIDPRIAAIGFVRILIIDEGIANLGHRMIMLSSKYTTVGIGFTQNSGDPLLNYVVQNFGNL